MSTMTTTQPDITCFTRLSESVADDLQPLREAGMRRFEATGLPGAKDEEWRFTNTDPLAEVSWQLAGPVRDLKEAHARYAIPGAIEVVLANGKLQALEGSLPRGLYVGPLSQAPAQVATRARSLLGRACPVELTPFVALNAGLLEDVLVIHVARGVAIDPCIHVLSLALEGGESVLFSPRVLIIAEDGSVFRVIETHAGESSVPMLSNSVVEVFAGTDAVVDHYQAQWNGTESCAIQSTVAVLQSAATYTHHHASLTGKLIRNDLHVVLDGERADTTLNGVVLVGSDRQVDNHTLIRHEKPNCTSHELYKHVVADESRGVFRGKIYVQKDAQHTDSKQTSRTLLLSDQAFMESMPALEIYADDVKCTHGSTIGPLDEQMLFYLRSRGLSADAAQHLLIYAFAADMTARMKAREMRKRIESFLAAQQDLPQDLSIEAT